MGYILREGLYGTCADLRQLSLEDLRCAAISMLRRRRSVALPHPAQLQVRRLRLP